MPPGPRGDPAAAPERRPSSARLLHEVLESLPQGVVMFDAEGRLQFRNSRYCETYGFAPEVLRPGMTMEAIMALRSTSGRVTAAGREYVERQLKAMREGRLQTGHHNMADGRTIHYINTPISTGGWIVTHEDVTHQQRVEAQIVHMASHDTLTDLPNRSAFQSHLEQALRFNSRDKLLAVMFLDLDNFKTINDTFGHTIGDELLKSLAARLHDSMRRDDLVARFGGDEFVVVSTGLDDPAEVAALAARIRETVLEPFSLLDHDVVIDSSIGIAVSPSDGTDAEILLKHADLALYSAKGSGRKTYRFFETEMDVRMTERRNLEMELRDSFANGEFEIHYQPLLNLKSNRVTCCEALLRWNNPVRGPVSPETFVPVAEEIGLIGRIGEWVIRSACAEAAKWPEDVTVAVNVSPVQFRSQNLVQLVVQALAASGLAPHRLELEITEAILLDHTEETVATLGQLHALGVRIAMDDFGTGFCSLSYLQKFPFDKIKIDQVFISRLASDEASAAIVRAINDIARSLHMITTAEGVESADQRAIVTALGCTEMQGHLFSTARPAEEIGALLWAERGEGRQPDRAPPGFSDRKGDHIVVR